MATINWRPAGAPVYGIMTADDGSPYDLTGAAIWLTAHRSSGDVQIAGEIIAPVLGMVGFDPTVLGETPRMIRLTAHVRWPDGAEERLEPEFILNIGGGCI